MSKLTVGSLFSGIGGFDLGLERAGMEIRFQVEIDPFCTKVLAKHWPDVPRFGDVKNVGKHNLEPVDVICGGFPCQDISNASSTKTGIGGERSGLWWEFARIICEICPRWVVIENVSQLLSSNDGWDFRTILWELSRYGYDAEWGTLSASLFGAPHQRRRVFIVAYSNEINGPKGMGSFFNGPAQIFGESPKGGSDFWLSPFSEIDRMDDGVSGKLYRYTVGAYGNAIVPQKAEWIGQRIIQVEALAT